MTSDVENIILQEQFHKFKRKKESNIVQFVLQQDHGLMKKIEQYADSCQFRL